MSKSVKLKGPLFGLQRVGDGQGDSGRLLKSIDPKTLSVVGVNGEIRLGCCVQCGSDYARSMQYQDFWLTTPVIKIGKIRNNRVEFQTNNSTYVAWGINGR